MRGIPTGTELGRLISAATTGPEWGLSWAYDGFGNRLSQSVTKGTGPVVSLSVDGATNRISSSGFVYDSNGNQTQWSMGGGTVTAAYDVENRMVQVTTSSTTEIYKYNAANQRVIKTDPYGAEMKHFVYGLGGELLGEYGQCGVGGAWYVPCEKQERVYFVGRLVQVEGAGKTVDRLGTVGQAGTRAYPYGEAQTEFATYRKDGVSGLDYAWNRYYSSTWGRFTSADPFKGSARSQNPASWNRFTYVDNDPVNYHDLKGLQKQMGTWWLYKCTGPDDDRSCSWNWGTFAFDDGMGGLVGPMYFVGGAEAGGGGGEAREDRSPAEQAQQDVLDGKINDCEAMGQFLTQMAAGAGSGAGSLAQGMREVTPHTRYNPAGVYGTTRYRLMNPHNSLQSGYKQEYRESDTADQGHHFALLFQLGLRSGLNPSSADASAVLSAIAISAGIELYQRIVGGSSNTADYRLGVAAYVLGADVAAGGVKRSDVGNAFVSQFCDSARRTP